MGKLTSNMTYHGCPIFTDTWLRLILGQEGCHGTAAETGRQQQQE